MPFDPLGPVTRLLIEGRDNIAAHGWCQKHYTMRGRVCALGALGIRSTMRATRPQRAAAERLKRAANTTLSLEDWNDLEGQSQENVLAVFDRAI